MGCLQVTILIFTPEGPGIRIAGYVADAIHRGNPGDCCGIADLVRGDGGEEYDWKGEAEELDGFQELHPRDIVLLAGGY